ncbi:MAG: hypothetical protein H6898_09340 [Rhodobacter sp.]|nr:hypothetical protein [Paracoccaceae bacterium]MCC0076774.1 hypothetical protein [Rhodobacter sp.]
MINPRRLPLVATGIAALSLGAVALQLSGPATETAVQPVRSASLAPVPVAPAPQIWLSSLAGPAPTSFAAPGYAHDAVLPRVDRPLPPLPERVRTASTPVESRPAILRAPAVALTVDPSILLAMRDIPRLASTPHGIAGETPLIDPQVAVATLRAPSRSRIPQARPQLATATAAPEVERVTPAMALALSRSRSPQPRPEAVTRLASLDMNQPTLVSAPAPSAAQPRPEPQAQPLEIPALNRALAGANPCESRLTRAIPRRGRAEDGSTLVGRLTAARGRERDDVLVSEVLNGNIPDFLRDLVPVTFAGEGPGGAATQVTICVMPDYLAVGSDRDFVRVPLGLPAAMRVAERFDMVLPTTRMVDAIYQQASVHLSPAPMTPGAQMESTGYFQRHNATIQQQMAQAGGRLGQLVSGHKKDLVLTNRLERNPGRVAIYGWHRRNGSAIQPLSTVHGAQYADYSHGIRLVSRRAYVNGRAIDLRDLLSDGRYAGLVSSEGTITNRTLLAALR